MAEAVRILVTGLPAEIVREIGLRLRGVAVTEFENTQSIGRAAGQGDAQLIVLSDALPVQDAIYIARRAKDASDSLSRLAKPSLMVTGRMGCPVSSNGAPDCKAAADQLCQSKGHKEGKSLDTDAAEKCSAKVYLPGHKREPGDCRTENYVTRALCQ